MTAIGFVAVACGVLSPEEQLLADFFQASRLRDTTVVAAMSAVEFNPRSDGIVDRFEIRQIDRRDDGQTRNLTVDAQIRGPDGQTRSRVLLITLRRQEDGRWFITALRPQPGLS